MSGKASILMIDDERHISAMTRDFLRAKGFAVDLRHHGNEVMDTLASGKHDLCILDVTMPFKDGFTLADEIHAAYPKLPLMFLTGRTDVSDRVKGLKLGAEDYITKPYSLEELELRIHNILRRNDQHSQANTYTFGKWSFKPATRELSMQDRTFELTTIESRLLQLFLSDPELTVRRFDALKEIWGDDVGSRQHSLKVYISKLRKFFADDPDIEILNIHGEGYRISLPEDRS